MTTAIIDTFVIVLKVHWVQDPVEGGPAVLVHRSSITRQKQAELLFGQQKDALEK